MSAGFEKLGIGPDKPPKLILDFCWNHEGSIGRVRQMLDALQRELYTQVGDRSLFDLVIPKFQAGRDLPWDRSMYRGVKRMCEDYGLPFLCTAFDYKAVDMLDSLDVAAIKIGSAEAEDKDFINYAYKTGRALIVSTGGMVARRPMALAVMPNIKVLHCVSLYPAPPESLALDVVASPLTDGYSSHYPGIIDAYFAMALGAQVIEKHYSLTPHITDQPGAGTDHAVSIGPHHVRSLCEASLLWHKMRGTTKSEETLEAERALLQPFRERFYANNHQADQTARQDVLPGGDERRLDSESGKPSNPACSGETQETTGGHGV